MVGGCWRYNVGVERRWATSSIIRTRQVVRAIGRAQSSCAWAEGLAVVFLYGMEGEHSVFCCNNT
jgi:hypothetical protein